MLYSGNLNGEKTSVHITSSTLRNSKLYLESEHGQRERKNTAVFCVHFAWGGVISRG